MTSQITSLFPPEVIAFFEDRKMNIEPFARGIERNDGSSMEGIIRFYFPDENRAAIRILIKHCSKTVFDLWTDFRYGKWIRSEFSSKDEYYEEDPTTLQYSWVEDRVRNTYRARGTCSESALRNRLHKEFKNYLDEEKRKEVEKTIEAMRAVLGEVKNISYSSIISKNIFG